MRGRKVLIALGIAITMVVGLGAWQWWRWWHSYLALDPQAKIDPDKSYAIDVWVETVDGLAPPPGLSDELWSEAEVEFRSLYPNVEVAFTELSKTDLEKEMQVALDAGRPPNILVTSGEWFRFWSDLQLPIDRFLPEEEMSRYLPAALARVKVGGRLMAWPSQIQPSLWVANRRHLRQLHDDADLALNTWGDPVAWSGDGWRNLEGKLERLRNLRLPPIAHQLGNSGSLLQVLLALSKGAVGQNGELLLSADLMRSVLAQWQIIQESRLMALVQGTLLTDFLSGNRVIVGPVGLWIWSLGENARGRGYVALKIPDDVALLPVPGGGGNGYLAGTMVDVIVFRRRRFQGLDHARLCMELAQELAKRLGTEMSRSRFGVPADKRLWDEWHSIVGWGPQEKTNLEEVLELATGLPDLEPHWHEARRQLITQILEPGLDSFVKGEIGAEVAERLEKEMGLLLESLQPKRSKGKLH